MKIKKLFPVFLISIIFLSFAISIYAQARPSRELDLEYPDIPGAETPETVTLPVPEYVRYIFNFAIWAAGILALLVLIYAGIQYFLSTGNPEKITDAKNRIISALIGLLILLGSYLILWSINPNLVTFELQRLRPILSELSPGVTLCKEQPLRDNGEDAILRAWDLMMEYKLLSPSIEREREIKQELDILLERVSANCYTPITAGNIRSDFDNEVQYVYFVPYIGVRGSEFGPEITSVTEYGAVIYEKRGFEGMTKILFSNLINPEGSADAYMETVNPLKPSAIKPFSLVYQPKETWEVILYEEYNYNQGLDAESASFKVLPGTSSGANPHPMSSNYICHDWWCNFINFSWTPKSLEIEGDLLAILCNKEPSVEKCHVFFNESANNLEMYPNIVEWVRCRESITGQFGPAWRWTKCTEAASTRILIIGTKPY